MATYSSREHCGLYGKYVLINSKGEYFVGIDGKDLGLILSRDASKAYVWDNFNEAYDVCMNSFMFDSDGRKKFCVKKRRKANL